MTKNESCYDLLRIISTLAVIMIHVSSTYKGVITGDEVFVKIQTEYIGSILLYNILPRFAVPCFVMLSGAFLLSDDRNAEYRIFYRKSMKKIGVPTIIFSVLYFLYSEVIVCIRIAIKGGQLSEILSPIKAFISGTPFYHMWYLYTLIGIYLLVPAILNFKRTIKEETFSKVSIVIILIASISGWTSSFQLQWSIAKVICYMGYLLIGYQIRRDSMNKKNNGVAVWLILLGVITELFLTYIQYNHSILGIAEKDEKYSLVGNFNPLVVIASILIFAGFSKLRINHNLKKVSSQTFIIYLFHAIVWECLKEVVKKIGVTGDCRVIIPSMVVLCFAISYIISVAYKRLWDKIDGKYAISDSVCNLFKLS